MSAGYKVRKIKPYQVGYKRGRLSTTVRALSVTAAYRQGADRLGWELGEGQRREFCPTCDFPVAWCECAKNKQQEPNG